MDSDADTPYGVGCPIRTSTDQRLLAAPHGFSQRATSFIASWCQGIHRMPFSYSIHVHQPKPMDTPCTETILRRQPSGPRLQGSDNPRNQTTEPRDDDYFVSHKTEHTKQLQQHASEHSPPDRWGANPERPLSRSDMQPDNAQGPAPDTKRQKP